MTTGSDVRVDPHIKVLNDGVVERAKARGIEAVVYAPHFTQLPAIQARAARYADDDLTIIPAREVFTGSWRNRQHVLALDLEAPVPDFISLEATFAELERQNAIVLVPHPDFFTISLDRAAIERFHEAIHGVETYNPKHLSLHNRRAEAISRTTGLPAFGSSYAHLPGTVGEAWTRFEAIDPPARSIIEAFRTGAPRSVEHRIGLGHQLRRASELAHLAYENSVAKFNRVVLSGTEPTHPDQPLYDGRFSVAR